MILTFDANTVASINYTFLMILGRRCKWISIENQISISRTLVAYLSLVSPQESSKIPTKVVVVTTKANMPEDIFSNVISL